WSVAVVNTAGESGSTSRLTSVCNALTHSTATIRASTVSCGMAAWPPLPWIDTLKTSPPAIIGPGKTLIVPSGMSWMTCRPMAAPQDRLDAGDGDARLDFLEAERAEPLRDDAARAHFLQSEFGVHVEIPPGSDQFRFPLRDLIPQRRHCRHIVSSPHDLSQ